MTFYLIKPSKNVFICYKKGKSMKFDMYKDYTGYLKVDTDAKEDEPSLFHVLLHNDEFTPMEFVIGILEKFFFMDRKKATDVMLEAHQKGKAPCGAFTRDSAETKVSQVIDYARTHEHPLICTMEGAV